VSGRDQSWTEDVLGPSFRALTLPLEPDDEGPRVATLVAYEPDVTGGPDEQAGPARAVLYVHGFSDYFFHEELARTLHLHGWAFFALDLHKYGRSLLPGQTPGYVTSLEEYDVDLGAAVLALEQRLTERRGSPTPVDLVLIAHSTGGLVATLWAARNPGRIAALVLNSPWLDTLGTVLLKRAARSILGAVSRRRPKLRLRLPEPGSSFRSISDTREGEWHVNPAWRPEAGFPVTVGWLAAVLDGHATLARGISVSVPVLVLCSAASTLGLAWKSAKLATDSVLDVEPMVRRAAALGPKVTIRRLPGALHDVFLSRGEARRLAVDSAAWWLDAYVPVRAVDAGTTRTVPSPAAPSPAVRSPAPIGED
jgi:alpha-beta hydrolase superfamily lysophospholipase